MSPKPPDLPAARPRIPAAALVAAAAVLPFLPLLTAPRMVDERILAHDAWKWLALDPLAPWSVAAGGSGTWRPLLVYLYRLDAAAPDAVAHGTNLLLHAGAALGVLAWLRRRLPPAGALLGALFFAVDPAHVATAGWIGGRADGAMALLAVAALLALDARRPLLCGLAAAAAVLFKETAVVLPLAMAALVFLERRGGAAGRSPGPSLAAAALGAGIAGGLSWAMASVDPGYVPSLGAALRVAGRWGPPTLLELAAPTFVPVGLPGVPRDLVGAAVALPLAALLLRDRAAWPGLALAALLLLPVAHVLPNDGGQWYLLLPSVGAALAWGAAGRRALGRLALPAVAGFALLAAGESVAWRRAAFAVDARIEEARAQGTGAPEPPRQDPRAWPHRGPSFCCGLPWQLLHGLGEEPPSPDEHPF